MNALKVLVAGMALLIIIGLGLMGYGLSRKTHPAAEVTPIAASPAGAFSTTLTVPRDSKIDLWSATNDRLVLHVSGGDSERILLVDPRSGQLAGSISLLRDRP